MKSQEMAPSKTEYNIWMIWHCSFCGGEVALEQEDLWANECKEESCQAMVALRKMDE